MARDDDDKDDGAVSAVTNTETQPATDGVAPTPRAVELATKQASRYDLLDEAGRGGLGRVFEAFDLELDRTIAIKELYRPGTANEARFVREAKITARLQHPSIVPLHEAGRWPNGTPFYTMKLIEGRSLKALIGDASSLDQRLALLPRVLAVAEAIAYAHRQGVVHRDLKPSNVMVGDFGETVVIDWGLAKETTAADPVGETAGPYRSVAGADGPTLAGDIVGTPSYMPPEQARGEAVDERADVYALGAILYHVLSGVPPYAGSSSDEVVLAVLSAEPTPLAAAAEGVPAELLSIVDTAMKRNASERYRNAADMARDLRRFQDGQLIQAHEYSAATLLARWLMRNRLAVAAAVAVVAIGMGWAARELSLRANAENERDRAVRANTELETASSELQTQHNELTLLYARTALESDPTEAIAWLRTLPSTSPEFRDAPLLGVQANRSGIAGHLYPNDYIIFAAYRYDGFDISSDGHTLLATSAGGGIRALGLTERSDVQIAADEEEAVTVRWLNDGRFLTLGKGCGIQTWSSDSADVATAQEIRPGSGQTDACYASSDGKLLLHLNGQDLSVHQMLSFNSRDAPRARTREADENVTITPDNKYALLAGYKGVEALDLTTGRIAGYVAGEHWGACISPDGTEGFFPGYRSGAVSAQLPEMRGLRPLAPTIRFSGRCVYDHQGMRVFAATAEGSLVVVDLESEAVRPAMSASSDAYSIARHPRLPIIALGTADGTVAVWHDDRRSELRLRRHAKPVHYVRFSADGEFLISASMADVRIWRIKDLLFDATAESAVAETFVHAAVAVSHAGDQLLMPSPTRAGLVVADPQLAVVATIELRGFAYAPAFSPDDTHIAFAVEEAGEPPRVELRTAAGASIRSVPLTSPVRELSFGPTGTDIAIGTTDGRAFVWQTGSGDLRLLAEDASPTAYPVAYGPDGALLHRERSSRGIAIIDPTTRQANARLYDRVTPHTTFSMSHDGAFVLAGSQDGGIRVWRKRAGKWTVTPTVMLGHKKEVTRVAPLPGGRMAASASLDGTVRLWDLETRSNIVLGRHADLAPVYDLIVLPDASAVISIGKDGKTRHWALPPDLRPGDDAAATMTWFERISSAPVDHADSTARDL